MLAVSHCIFAARCDGWKCQAARRRGAWGRGRAEPWPGRRRQAGISEQGEASTGTAGISAGHGAGSGSQGTWDVALSAVAVPKSVSANHGQVRGSPGKSQE